MRSTRNADALLPPGSTAPPFSLQLTNGTTITYEPGTSSPLLPLYVYAFNPLDANSQVMFSDNSSVAQFLNTLPPAAPWFDPSTTGGLPVPRLPNFLFLSYGVNPSADVAYLQQRFTATMAALNYTDEQMQSWNARLMFCAQGVSNLTDAWIPQMLSNWTSPLMQVKLWTQSGPQPQLAVSRIDSHYTWLPWPTVDTNMTIVPGGDACGAISPLVKNASVALLNFSGAYPGFGGNQSCTFAQAIVNAQNAGANNIVFIAPQGAPYVDMNCISDADCNLPAQIPASLVSYEDGARLTSLLNTEGLSSVNMTYHEDDVSGFYFIIDETDALREMGWIKYAMLAHVAWQAQYQGYLAQLRFNLSIPALEVPVLNYTLMLGSPGAQANITLPPAETLLQYDTMEVYAALTCPTPWDTSCAVWDRTVEAVVTCMPADGEVQRWSAELRPEVEVLSATGETVRSPVADWKANGTDPLANYELARWICPFRRAVGAWITDASELLPLLTRGEQCTFTMYTDAWAMPWYDTLTLRFRNSSSAASNPLRPLMILPLYTGGTFDSNFNSHYAPISFSVPEWAQKVVLHAVITGHGSDNNGCCEFADTQHVFTITPPASVGQPVNHTLAFDIAGTPYGTLPFVPLGAVPGEHGTWIFGRGGWQDGNKVPAWLQDLTSEVAPPGSSLQTSISYMGLYDWANPDPTESPGYIIMSSALVFYG